MFIKYSDPSVRFTGRFAPLGGAMTATAPGSSFLAAFTGREINLNFDMTSCELPLPHVYITLDGGARIEAALDYFLRVEAENDGEHIVEVILKSEKEKQSRWTPPLVAKMAFRGYEADGPSVLPPDTRRTIELVGDSITEGVLVDGGHCVTPDDDQNSRSYEDNVVYTYGYLTAKALGLRSLHMGYGAVGVTKSGCGGVPKAAEAYPYCFEGATVCYDSGEPDYILINHGCNDTNSDAPTYIGEYRGLLDVIRSINPHSRIIVLSAFYGVYPSELDAMIKEYNRKNEDNIIFIDSAGWVPQQPVHPLRDGHRIIADRLISILRRELKL